MKFRYEANPPSYDTEDPNEMAEIDAEGMADDPGLIFDLMAASNYTVEVKPV